MIKVNNVGLVINKKTILENINLELENGQIHGLVGRNGCGKTMLMKCICGFVHPTTGSVEVDGVVIGKDRDFPKSLGVIIEVPDFIPHYTGYQNLKLLADLNHKIGKTEIRDAIERVGLDPDLKLPIRKYSLGMRQRLGIAQAFMENPDMLVLDEPFNSLDEEAVQSMRALLLDLKDQGKTILIASHSGEDISVLCDTVTKMSHGKLLTE